MSEGSDNPKKVSFRNMTGTFKSFSTEVGKKVTKTLQLKPLSSNRNSSSKNNDDVSFDDIHKRKFSSSFHNPMKSINNQWKNRDSDDDDVDNDDGNDNDEVNKNKKANENEDQGETEFARKPIQESSDLYYEEDDKKELERLLRILDSEGITKGSRILEESEESASKKSFIKHQHLTEFEHKKHRLKITRNLKYIRDRRCDECKVNHYHRQSLLLLSSSSHIYHHYH